MKCAKCGAVLAAEAKFCAQCGATVVAGVFCPSCGRASGPDQKFCPHCGKPLGAPVPPNPPIGGAMPANPPPAPPAPSAATPDYSPPLPVAGSVPPAGQAAATPATKERSGCCVCGLIAAGILAILLGLAGLAYWQGWLDKIIDSMNPKVGIPMAELKNQGRSPIEVTKCQFNALSSSVGIPNFTIAFRNISDCKVKMINAVMVLYGANGNLLENWRQETGYAELAAINPGEEIEGKQACAQKDARSAKIIIREVIYLDNPMKGKKGSEFYEVAFKWSNPNFAKELAAVTGGKTQ